jgi:hypothetical protein
MNRRKFLNDIFRWCLVLFLTGLTILLGKRIVLERNCSSCPEYAACQGTGNCGIKKSTPSNG